MGMDGYVFAFLQVFFFLYMALSGQGTLRMANVLVPAGVGGRRMAAGT